MSLKKLPRSFYLRPTLKVARELLGCLLVRKIGKHRLIGRIVEVEAYLGEKDPASHAYRGRTRRNEVMFWRGGHLYVYFTYGMHFCANVVTEAEGVAHAVLLRAIEPVAGMKTMKNNRRKRGPSYKVIEETNAFQQLNLTNGPAKLCEALRIARTENGTDLLGNDLYLVKGKRIGKNEINLSTRIGIQKAVDKRWRFSIQGNPWVSKTRRTRE